MPGGPHGPLARLLGQATYGFTPSSSNSTAFRTGSGLWELQLHWPGQDRPGDKQNTPCYGLIGVSPKFVWM